MNLIDGATNNLLSNCTPRFMSDLVKLYLIKFQHPTLILKDSLGHEAKDYLDRENY